MNIFFTNILPLNTSFLTENKYPLSTSIVTIPSGTTYAPVISSGNTGSVKDVTIASGTSLTNGGTLTVAGTISNGGTLTSTSGTLIYNGTGAQSISGNDFANRILNGLVVNKASGTATLTDSLRISDSVSVIAGTFNMNNQPISLKSDAANTARIAPVTGIISNATKVTVERYIPSERRAYRLLAPSVTTTTSINANWQEGVRDSLYWGNANINPRPGYGTHITGSGGYANGFDVTATSAPSLYSYVNPQDGTPAWVAKTSTLTNTLDATKGYLMFFRGDRSIDLTSQATPLPTSASVIRATGTIKVGEVSFSGLSNSGATLITNPYVSPLNWANVYANNSNGGNLSSFYTYWDPALDTRGGYVTVDIDGTTVPSTNATQHIQSGQAFFIKGLGNASPATLTVNIEETHKSMTGNINVFKSTATYPQLAVNLYFYDGTGYRQLADGLLARFDETYSKGSDFYDADEIANFDENIRWVIPGRNLSIDSRPLVAGDTLFMQTARFTTRTYEFEFKPQLLDDKNVTAQLVDKYTGAKTNIDLTATSVISFSVNTSVAATTDPSRFYVLLNSNAPLPVTLTEITAYQKSSGINVDWMVAQEINMDRYEVEKSVTGNNFAKAGAQKVTGNTTYSWFDAQPDKGANFYRIKMIDKNGFIAYSKIVKIIIGSNGAPQISVYPNPVVGNTAILQLTNIKKGNYELTISNKLGQIVLTQSINHAGGSATQNLGLNLLPQGTYQLKIAGITMQLVKQ